QQLGFNICLGTDSLASNDDLNLFSELRLFAEMHPNVPPRQILEMVTVNSADALRQADQIGRIRPGFYADLVAIESAGAASPIEEIVSHTGAIKWMMAAGCGLVCVILAVAFSIPLSFSQT